MITSVKGERTDLVTPQNTAVVIVLDWTKPSTMVRELLAWLAWVDQWAQRADKGHSDGDELRERCKLFTCPKVITDRFFSAITPAALHRTTSIQHWHWRPLVQHRRL